MDKNLHKQVGLPKEQDDDHNSPRKEENKANQRVCLGELPPAPWRDKGLCWRLRREMKMCGKNRLKMPYIGQEIKSLVVKENESTKACKRET